MTNQEIKEKFESLTVQEKKSVYIEVGILKQCGAEYFYVETGSQVNDLDAQETLKAFAMAEIGLIAVDEFYGI